MHKAVLFVGDHSMGTQGQFLRTARCQAWNLSGLVGNFLILIPDSLGSCLLEQPGAVQPVMLRQSRPVVNLQNRWRAFYRSMVFSILVYAKKRLKYFVLPDHYIFWVTITMKIKISLSLMPTIPKIMSYKSKNYTQGKTKIWKLW